MDYTVETDGFLMVEGLLGEAEVDALIAHVQESVGPETRRGGVRNLLEQPRMLALSECVAVRREVEAILGTEALVVRGILFDKTNAANWKVPWHQDVTIAVGQRVEADSFGPWSMKSGVLHVQPPAGVLERMISVRLHLDDCPAENGALRVIAGSHRDGKVSERLICERAENSEAVVCAMKRGGALMMRPLLFHASSPSSVPGHRRVIHFDYAAVDLPFGMGWAAGLMGA